MTIKEILFRDMLRVRLGEDAILRFYGEGLVHGTIHTCAGHEASAVGVMAALGESAMVFSNHRNHGHYLAHGGGLVELFAEVMGREAGVCKGWGGSQHLEIPDRFISGGILGGLLPAAIGCALSYKLDGIDRISCAFIGDGTFGQGIVYECLNLAALWKLPFLLVVEDNCIAQSTPRSVARAGSLEERINAFGIDSSTLTFPSPIEVYDAARVAVARLRQGKGPAALVMTVPRLNSHSKGDDTRGAEEVAELRTQDPVTVLEAQLETCAADAIRAGVLAEVESAGTLAKASPPAQLDFASFCSGKDRSRAHDDAIYSAHPLERGRSLLHVISGKRISDQLNTALRTLLRENARSVVLGEDILDPYGGAFKITQGLSSEFEGRVMSTPISEAGIVGAGLGLALCGWTAIVEVMFGDFTLLAADQLLNQAAKRACLAPDDQSISLIVRTPMGGRRGYGPTHSQCLEKHFLGMPGLTIVAPSYLHDYASTFAHVCQIQAPVLFIEHKLDYGRVPAPAEDGTVDDMEVTVHGADGMATLALSFTGFEDDVANVFCYGGMLPTVMEAARELILEHEYPVRIIVPSLIDPVPVETLREAASMELPMLTVEEHTVGFGWGAEVSARLQQATDLRPRTSRVGAAETAIPGARALEEDVLPGKQRIVTALLELLT